MRIEVSAPHVEWIYSSLSDDPVLGELVELFVAELPARVDTLLCQTEAKDWEALERSAHQLKGAFGSYGFGQLTASAERLEATAQDARPEAEILDALGAMIALCKRVRFGGPEHTGGG